MSVHRHKPLLFRGVPSTVIFTVFLAFSSVYIPILGLFSRLIWSVPLAVLTAQAGLRRGVLASVISLIWLGLAISPVWAAITAFQFAGIGLVLGILMTKGTSSGRMIAITTAVSILITLLVFVVPVVTDDSFSGFAVEFRNTTNEVYKLWEDAGLVDRLQEQGMSGQEIRESLESAVDWVIRLLPALMATSALGIAFFNFLGARSVLRKTGFSVPGFPVFSRWYVPWHLSWAVIGGLGLTLLGDYVGNKTIFTAGQNIVFICVPAAFIIGLSTAAYMFSKVHSKVFKACVVFGSFFYLPLTVMLLLLIGVFDPLFDFRKIHFKSV